MGRRILIAFLLLVLRKGGSWAGAQRPAEKWPFTISSCDKSPQERNASAADGEPSDTRNSI